MPWPSGACSYYRRPNESASELDQRRDDLCAGGLRKRAQELDRLAASTWLGLVDEDGAACGRVGTGVEIENDRAAGAQSVRDVATGVYVISGVCATVEIYLAEVTEDKILVYPELFVDAGVSRAANGKANAEIGPWFVKLPCLPQRFYPDSQWPVTSSHRYFNPWNLTGGHFFNYFYTDHSALSDLDLAKAQQFTPIEFDAFICSFHGYRFRGFDTQLSTKKIHRL